MLKKPQEQRMPEYENWLEGYRLGTNAEEKGPYLEKGLKEDPSPENDYRSRLFAQRFLNEKGESTGADHFMAQWMEIMYLRERGRGFFGKGYSRKRAGKILKELLADQAETESLQQVLYEELKNMGEIYIDLCQNDKNYGSIIMGFGSMKESNLKAKIAYDMTSCAVVFPRMIEMEKEFAPLAKAAKAAYLTAFPFNEEIWNIKLAETMKQYLG